LHLLLESSSHHEYQAIDLESIAENYLPRSNYSPIFSTQNRYESNLPRVTWGEKKNITEYYRVVHREMLSQSGERTFIASLLPQKVSHINTCIGTAFENNERLLDFYSLCVSLPVDFRVKSTGLAHAYISLIKKLPVLSKDWAYRDNMHFKCLMLSCLTSHFDELWRACWKDGFRALKWTKKDERLDNDAISQLCNVWSEKSPLRNSYARRFALIEIDVLASMYMGITLEELKTIYKVQFPVLKKHESETFYDRKGKIIFTNNSQGLPGVGYPRNKTKTEPIGWNDIKDMQSGTVERTIIDDTQPGGPVERTITYEAPFDRCDREKDYEVVWAEFERRFKQDGGKGRK
jgi:hypothetical protein